MLENWFDPEAIAIVLCGTLAATMLRCTAGQVAPRQVQ